MPVLSYAIEEANKMTKTDLTINGKQFAGGSKRAFSSLTCFNEESCLHNQVRQK